MIIIYSPLFAQKITGEVRDEAGKPVVAATAFLRKVVDSSLVKMSITGNNGAYEFLYIKPGNYFVKVTNVGFTNNRSNDFTYTADGSFTVPGLTIYNNIAGLKAVEVTAQKPAIEVKADKIIFNKYKA